MNEAMVVEVIQLQHVCVEQGMLALWTIYDHPTDHPDRFVARMFVLDKPTEHLLSSTSLDLLRDVFDRAGLVCMTRAEDDDRKIVETWL